MTLIKAQPLRVIWLQDTSKQNAVLKLSLNQTKFTI